MNMPSAMMTEDRGGETHRLFVEWFVDGERSSIRRGVVAFEYSSAKNGDFSLNGTSRFRTRAARDLSHGDWCNRLSAAT
jgi:hypothetical protein